MDRCTDGKPRHEARAAIIGAVVAVAGTSCGSGSPSVIDPRGPAAHRIATLWWVMLVLSAIVFVFVCTAIVVAIVRGRRRSDEDARGPASWGGPFIVIGGIVITGIVLVGVFVFSITELRAIGDAADGAKLTVSVVGHDWWWEARYPNGAVTANEIHIPAGEPVRLRLTTDDVIHSFWVPQLAAKTDMVPGKTNLMSLEADEPGRYRGQCAEFCGLQHANMAVIVVADERAAFEDWVRDQAEPRAPPTGRGARGERVFLQSTCVGCHAIRGTPATAEVGPDLTHLASRDTLASGRLENSIADLVRFIEDPQDAKPGATMPPTKLSEGDLRDLVAYLRGLR